MLARIGVWEILFIIAILSLIFGSKKLPLLGKSFGTMFTNFKSAVSGKDADIEVVKK